MGSRIIFTAPPGFMDTSWADRFAKALHDGGDELGQLEQFNVMKRTPVLTGALQADVSYTVGRPNTKVIATIFSDTTEQLLEWNRVYMLYQEGGALGKPTFTNGPHEMYNRIRTDDLSAIETWGVKWLQDAANKLAAGVTP